MGWKDYVVRVVAQYEYGGKSIATGYPVSQGRILTALHAVRSDERNIVKIEVYWCCMNESNIKRSKAKKIWPKDEAIEGIAKLLDAAILDCEFPCEIVDYYPISKVPPANGSDWESEGFAKIKENGDPVGIRGKVTVKAEKYQYLELSNECKAESGDEWKGASGAAVVVNRRVVGVISTCLKKANGSIFMAVPAWILLDQDGFEDACNFKGSETPFLLSDNAKKFHKSLCNLPALADELELNPAESNHEATLDVLDAISAIDLLKKAVEAADEIRSQVELDKMRQFIFELLPYKFCGQSYAKHPLTGVVPVKTINETTLDVHMSGLHRRPVSLNMGDVEDGAPPSGIYNIGRLAPTGISRKKFVDEFTSVLDKNILKRLKVKSTVGNKSREEHIEDTLRQKRQSEYLREVWYYDAEASAEGATPEDISKRLSEINIAYPSLELVEQVGSDNLNEDGDIRDLLTLLVHMKIDAGE